jgi:hypothetical protein
VRAQVRDGIARLPQHYREALLLRDIEELDTDQTAQRLDTTRSTVKTRLHRARQGLSLVPILVRLSNPKGRLRCHVPVRVRLPDPLKASETK